MKDFELVKKLKCSTTRFRMPGIFYALLLVLNCSPLVLAQEVSDDIAPPPPKVLSKEERKQLEGEPDLKKHLVLSLGLLERHTSQAEVFTSDNSFEDALAELGNFEAVLNEALKTLSNADSESGKVQSSAKMIEAALRKFSARLELMRRKMPFTYSYHVQKLIKVVREARGKAIEPFWGEVIPQKTKN